MNWVVCNLGLNFFGVRHMSEYIVQVYLFHSSGVFTKEVQLIMGWWPKVECIQKMFYIIIKGTQEKWNNPTLVTW